LLEGLKFLLGEIFFHFIKEVVDKGGNMLRDIARIGIGGDEAEPQGEHSSNIPLRD